MITQPKVTQRQQSTHPTIDILFEQQAKKTPDKIALVCNHETITYRALNKKANQLAHYLKSIGIGSETVVAFRLPRSIEAITVILAVFKAGGAYLPIDPHEPKARLQKLLQESEAVLLIEPADNQIRKHDIHTYPKQTIDVLKYKAATYPITPPKKCHQWHHLAYIINTSGSTGFPKGVEIEHKSIPNMALTHISFYKMDEYSHALEFSSLHFDASVSEIFTALICGATLYIPSEEIRSNPLKLLHYLIHHEITVASIPPVILARMPRQTNHSLKTLVVAGDICPKKVMDFWQRHCRIVNGYGPTETTVMFEEC